MSQENNGTVIHADDNNWSATTTTSGFKSMEQMNLEQPELRDLEITVTGLNVLDVQFAGPGVWVPTFTVRLSGDQGIDTTGQRRVYLSAAEFLRATLLNNGTGDGTAQHAFVPHANISRDDLDGDIADAVRVANNAIEGLLQAHREPVYNGENSTPLEAFSWFGKSLYITARTVDFELTEKRILNAEAFDKLQELINAPVEGLHYVDGEGELQGIPERAAPEVEAGVNEWLVEHPMLRGTAEDINAELLKGPRPDGFFEELVVSNVTKFFDGVQHASVVLEGGFAAPNQVFWIPADRAEEFPSLEAIRSGTVLTCISNGDRWVEYLVQIPSIETAVSEIKPDVRNETKLFDGIQHKLLVIPTEEGSTETNKLWVPVNYQGVITTFDDLSDTALLTCLSAKGESPTEWRLLEKEALLSDVDTGDLFLVQTDDHVSVNDIIAKMTEHGIVSEGNAFNHKAVADYVEGYVAGTLATAARKEPIHKELQSAVLAAAEKVAGVIKH